MYLLHLWKFLTCGFKEFYEVTAYSQWYSSKTYRIFFGFDYLTLSRANIEASMAKIKNVIENTFII